MVTTTTNPTPDEIEKATAEIRERWNEHEYRRRASVREEFWEVPILRFLGDSSSTECSSVN